MLLHQFDGLESTQRPWEACVTGCTVQGMAVPGRVSAMIIYRGMKERADRVALPLPFGNRGGVVLRPSEVWHRMLHIGSPTRGAVWVWQQVG